MKAAIYSRVSTKDKGQDTENQVRQLKEFANTQGWTIVAEYADNVSGKTADRDAFQEMFAAASRHEFDVVLFWSLDRFSREGTLATLTHLKRLGDYGVTFRSFTEQYLDSTGMFKDAIIGFIAAIAKQERIRLSERTVAGLERARAQGKVGGRPVIVCDRDEVRELRASGMSLGKIATKMKLSKTTVHAIVKAQSSL